MRHYPVFLDLRGRRALVLGDGEVAARKAAPLRAAGADIVSRARFDPADLAGCALAIGADAPESELRALAAAARAAGIPVNVVDRPDLGTCVAPALIDRDPITVAISTAGTAPVLARMLRQRIEALLPPWLGRLAELADRFAVELRRAVPDPAARRPLLEAALAGPAGDLLGEGRDAEAAAAFAAALRGAGSGRVDLIGAGPGDPDLLTLRAHRLMGEADVILCDPGLGEALLGMARRDAARAEAGADAVERAADLARAGRRVAWLAAGDGTARQAQADALLARGVAARIVPGVARPAAAPAGADAEAPDADAPPAPDRR
jgi:uroporphyrin-III C-methyltransferase/precorrin-2 dehydrogenase/sirohydrochlorin ferrochelatase